MFYLIIFFHYQKRDMTSSVTWSERFEYFSLFLKYIFRHRLASFSCFSLQIFTLYYPWVIIILFSKQKQSKLSQKFKSSVNWPILQIKIEKETYSWDFCKILFQLNCLFTEINVQRLLIEENFKNWKDVFGGHIVFLHSREKGQVAALLTLNAKWFATLT